MKKNFFVDKGVYLLNQDNCYDLHNNYHFHQCTIIPNKATIILIWLRLDKEWVQDNQPKEVVINFQNVSFFEISKNFIADRPKTIEEIGYKEPFDEDLDWLNRDENFKVTDHIIFRFENDEFMRIHAEYAEVKEA